jgi:hypothetical protein
VAFRKARTARQHELEENLLVRRYFRLLSFDEEVSRAEHICCQHDGSDVEQLADSLHVVDLLSCDSAADKDDNVVDGWKR